MHVTMAASSSSRTGLLALARDLRLAVLGPVCRLLLLVGGLVSDGATAPEQHEHCDQEEEAGVEGQRPVPP